MLMKLTPGCVGDEMKYEQFSEILLPQPSVTGKRMLH